MFWFPSLVSEELSEAVAIVPAPQGLTLPWPPPVIFDPDPWHVHLDLHRRSCPETSSRWVPLCQSSSTAGGLHHVRLRGLHPCWEEPACMLWRNMGGGSVLSRLLTAVLTVCSLWWWWSFSLYKSLPVLLFSSADAPARPPRRSAARSTSPDTGDSRLLRAAPQKRLPAAP